MKHYERVAKMLKKNSREAVIKQLMAEGVSYNTARNRVYNAQTKLIARYYGSTEKVDNIIPELKRGIKKQIKLKGYVYSIQDLVAYVMSRTGYSEGWINRKAKENGFSLRTIKCRSKLRLTMILIKKYQITEKVIEELKKEGIPRRTAIKYVGQARAQQRRLP